MDIWDGPLDHIVKVKHLFDLTSPDVRPIHSAQYRAGRHVREFGRDGFEKLLKMKGINPAQTEWAAPTVFIPNKDGALRIRVDYQKFNVVTIRDSYRLRRMDDCIHSIGDAWLFPMLDASSGYWRIEVREQDRDKTTFISHHGLLYLIRIPFGLRNAVGTFKRVKDVILATVMWQRILKTLTTSFSSLDYGRNTWNTYMK